MKNRTTLARIARRPFSVSPSDLDDDDRSLADRLPPWLVKLIPLLGPLAAIAFIGGVAALLGV